MRRRSSRSRKNQQRTIRVIYLAGVLALALLLLYAWIFEPRNVQLETQDVAVPNLPQSLDGFRVVQLSDLHRSKLTPDAAIEKAVRVANEARPDIVVLTGDYVSDNIKNIVPCVKMLSELKPKLGTYAILGNHDYSVGANSVVAALQACGAKVLVNANTKLPGGLYLIGFDDFGSGKRDIKSALAGVPKSAPRLLLSHNPMEAQLLQDQEGIMISGHTHGGQIRNPFIPGSRHPQTVAGYIDGWYLNGRLMVYVNRGIGVTNVPFRFCCSPEVTLFILRPVPTFKH